MSDPAKYRARSEVDAVRQQKDCIENLKEILQENKVTDDELKGFDTEIKSTVSKAAELERVDWVAFLKQSKEWIRSQSNNYKVKSV